MNFKKGFTLIEIIVAIALIAVIGTASFVGVKYALDSNKITSLSQVEDEILNALKIYLETDDIANKQLYGKESAVVTPIKLLINKGLLDLSNTDISEEDIEKNYVVTAFMSNVTGDYQCMEAKDLRTITSWDESLSQPLYICTSLQVSGDDTDEIRDYMEKSNDVDFTSERYYLDPNYNYAKFTKNGVEYSYRILYVDTDNTYVLVKNGTFGDVFDDSKTAPISNLTNLGCAGTNSSSKCIYTAKTLCGSSYYITSVIYNDYSEYSRNVVESGEVNLDISDIKDAISNSKYTNYTTTSVCDGGGTFKLINGQYMSGVFPLIDESDTHYNYVATVIKYSVMQQYYKISLKSCMKFESGNGTIEKPYIIIDTCE